VFLSLCFIGFCLLVQATICDVAVDPLYQRRGIGRRIVKELVKVCRSILPLIFVFIY
jgi:ribosomal protein S18 acetylase RimI-like enzyme